MTQRTQHSTLGKKAKGALLTMLVLSGALAVAAIPMVVAVVITRLIPVVGEGPLHASGWDLLHFLWIYAVLYGVIVLLEKIGKHKLNLQPFAQNCFEGTGILVALSIMYLVFFAKIEGAVVAAVLSLVLYVVIRPITKTMERAAEKRT